MPSLFEYLQSPEAQPALSLLAAAGPSATPMSFGQRLQGGLLAAKAQQQEAEDRAMKRRFADAQIEDFQSQAIQRRALAQKAAADEMKMRAEQERQQRIMQGLPGLYRQGSPGTADVNSALPPDLQIGAQPPQRGGFDLQGAMRLGITDPGELTKLAGLTDLGRPEVARTIKGMGADGREYETQYDKFGQQVGQGAPQYRAPLSVNQGDRTTYLDPYTLKPQTSMQTFQSPDSKASTAVGWANNAATLRGQNMVDARAREQMAQNAAGQNKPQFHDGQWVTPPTADNPQGQAIQVPGFQKPLGEGPKKQLAGIQSLNGAIDEYLKDLEGWTNVKMLNPNERARMGTKYNNMMLQAKEAYNLGVLNGPDYSILTSIVSDPLSPRSAAISTEALKGQATELKRIMGATASAVRAGGSGAEASSSANQPARFGMLPKAADYAGKRMQADDGTIYKSNGARWVKE